jgi:hypothetical protein
MEKKKLSLGANTKTHVGMKVLESKLHNTSDHLSTGNVQKSVPVSYPTVTIITRGQIGDAADRD